MTTLPRSRDFSQLFLPALLLALCLLALPATARAFSLGVNADNWKGEMRHPRFAEALKALGVEFVVLHLSPEEETDPARLQELVDFFHANNLKFLFNTEIVNYAPNIPHFKNPDGTYRWDLKPATMAKLKDDPLFVGEVYDEPMLMQAMNGVPVGDRVIPPYFVDTAAMTPEQAFTAVSEKIRAISDYHASYGKKAVFEMVFPDYAHAAARGGAVLAPKLLKEASLDLMFATYAGAARQYGQDELWACVDLWFLDKFPEKGRYGPGYHTPEQLKEALAYAYVHGFDYVYVEHVKGLVNLSTGELTEYGRAVQSFNAVKPTLAQGDWRSFVPELVVKRFPDGYWGQKFSPFVPDHPYGAFAKPPYLARQGAAWLKLLSTLSNGKLPSDAATWNASNHPYFAATPYFPIAGLPPMLVVDHTFALPGPFAGARVEDLTAIR